MATVDRLRVISGRHLSKHEIDRETYMQEYRFSPDELAAKDWRSIRSSRKGYHAYDRREWIAELKRLYKVEGHVSTKYLQCKYPSIYQQSLWIFGNWDKALRCRRLESQNDTDAHRLEPGERDQRDTAHSEAQSTTLCAMCDEER
jgi:hypothetical protein